MKRNIQLTIIISTLFAGLFLTPNIFASDQNISNDLGVFESIGDTLGSIASRVVTLNNVAKLESDKTNFSRSETPTFTVAIPHKDDADIGRTVKKKWQKEDEMIIATLTRKGDSNQITTVIKKTDEGSFTVAPESLESLKPGSYTLSVEAKESFVYTRDLTQNFSWGVLAINTNKSIYAPGETAKLSFGVVDDLGHTICDAKISLVITAPNGDAETLSTDNKKISESVDCQGDTYTLKPDYFANYATNKKGQYQMNVTATTQNGSHTIQDYFEVQDSVPFDVERTQFPSRIYPRESYDVKLTIKANENYSGKVTDFVPKDFRIYSISNGGTVSNRKLTATDNNLYLSTLLSESEQAILSQLKDGNPEVATNSAELHVNHESMPIAWDVNWKSGQTYTLSYTIVFPLKSPEFYLLGPLTAGSFKEIRQWQIAGDAVKCWDGGGSTNNWTEAANWDGDIVPATTDVATFGETGSCSAIVGTPDKDVTLNSGFVNPSGAGGGINIQSSYSGVMTQGTGVSLTIGDQGFTQAAGTFTGSASTITIQSGGDFTLSGGTFIATSGTFTPTDNFTISGGTFNHNSGTISYTVAADNSATITATATFNNLTLTGGFSNCGTGRIFTIDSTTNLTVSGTITFNASCSSALNGTGTVNAQGNVTALSAGFSGTQALTLNGSGNTQTITGDADGAMVPGLTFSKATGTVSFVDRVNISTGGWINNNSGATMSFGTSTIYFYSAASTTTTYNGDTTFYNLGFNGGSGCSGGNSGHALASGTDFTVTGTLMFNDGSTCDAGSLNGPGAIYAQGDITMTASNEPGITGTAVIYLTAAGDQTITGDSDSQAGIPGININKPSGSVTFTNNVNISSGGWTIDPSNAASLTFTGSTIYFLKTQTISGSTAFNNVTFVGECSSSNEYTYTIASGTTITTTGTLTFSECTDSGTSTINGPGSFIAQGNIASTNNGFNGTANITLSGTASQTLTLSGTSKPGNWTINKSTGTVTLAAALSLNTSGQDMTLTSGTLDLAGFNLTVNDQFTIGANGTIKLQGSETASTIDSGTSGWTAEYTGTGTYTELMLTDSYSNLKISGSGSYTLDASTSVTGNLTQSAGTLNLSSNTITIGGNFTKTGGTFTASTGTVVFNTSTTPSTISGDNTFYNVTVTTPGKQLYFTAGTTQTVTGTITLRGQRSNPILLNSTSSGTDWNLDLDGSSTVVNVSVQDSDASAGSVIAASNSADQGNNTNWTFSGSTSAEWYDSAWSKRKLITINHHKVAGDLTNFPVLINISSDADLAAYAQSDGDDILFTSDDATKIPHEIEKYTTATGALVAWVKVPNLSSSSDTVLYMYFGNSNASNQQDITNVYDSNYKMVQHLGEATSCPQTFSDSTSNNNDGICAATPASATGKIGNAQNVTAGLVKVPTSSSLGPTSAITIQTWINATSQGTGPFMSYDDPNSTALGPFMWRFSTYANFYWQTIYTDVTGSNIQSSALLGTGTWHHVVGTYDGSTVRAYVDGQPVGTPVSASKTLRTNGYDFAIGGYLSGTYFPGSVDEVRISSTARSAEWIATEYNNQSAPTAFFSISNGSDKPSTYIKGGTTIRQGTRITAQ